MSDIARFLTNLVKPWDELNELLIRPFAFQPDLSDVTRFAGALATDIKHESELRGISRKVVDQASQGNRLMSDIADARKHGLLRDPSRNNRLSVRAQFEFEEGRGFRFVRNIIHIEHASIMSVSPSIDLLDFMHESAEAIMHLIRALGISISWVPKIAEATGEFEEWATLYFNPKYQITMSETRYQFCRRLDDGTYSLESPSEIRFRIFEWPAHLG